MGNISGRRLAAFSAALQLVWGLAPLVLAQELEEAQGELQAQTEAVAVEPGVRGGIEEIVVTARRREESLQTVPIPVTTFSDEDIRAQNTEFLQDLTGLVPNFDPSGDGFNIRGMSDPTVRVTTDPAVNLYINGVLHPRSASANYPLVGIERVEVLRGPQGILFGRNTTGGAINLITKRPHGEFETTARFRLGNHQRYDYFFDVNVPLGDELALLASFERTKRDGFGRDAAGRETRAEEQSAFFGTLRWEPTEDLEILVDGDWRRIQDRGQNARSMIAFTSDVTNATAAGVKFLIDKETDGVVDGTPTPEDLIVADGHIDFDVTGTDREWLDVYNYGIATTINYAITPNVNTKLILAQRWLYKQDEQSLDATPARVLQASLLIDQKHFSSEFHIYGTHDIFGFNTDWLVGAFYLDEHAENGSSSSAVPGFSASAPTLPWGVNDVKSTAGFSAINVHLVENPGSSIMERLTFNAGGRYTRDAKRFVSTNSAGAFASAESASRQANGRLVFQQNKSMFDSPVGFENTGGDSSAIWSICVVTPEVLDGPSQCRATFTERDGVWSYDFGLDWQVFDSSERSLMLYGKVSRGFRSGGFNLSNIFATNYFEPEYVENWEGGFKSDWLDGKLRLNLTAFTLDYDDIQVSTLIAQAGGSIGTRITNAAKARVHGLEVEMIAQLLPSFQLRATFGRLDGEYTDFPDFQPRDPEAPFDPVTNPLVLIDRSDEHYSSGSPDWTYSISGLFTHPLSFGTLNARVDWMARDDARTSGRLVEETPITPEKAFGLWNARLALDLELSDSSMELAIWCRNCWNKSHKGGELDIRDTLGYALVGPADERTYGAEITLRY